MRKTAAQIADEVLTKLALPLALPKAFVGAHLVGPRLRTLLEKSPTNVREALINMYPRYPQVAKRLGELPKPPSDRSFLVPFRV